jgi:hypothetical protein
VVRSSLLAAVVLPALGIAGVSACNGHHADRYNDPVTTQPANDAAPAPPCRIFSPLRETAMAFRGDGSLAVASGPNGVRTFFSSGWWDARHRGVLDLAPWSAVGFTGSGYLVANRRTLQLYDPTLSAQRMRRKLAFRACEPKLLETPHGALWLYRRTVRETGDCDQALGSVFMQRLTAKGSAFGPAVQIGRGAPDRARVAAFDARLDAGRVVLFTHDQSPGAPRRREWHFTVLTDSGVELLRGDGDNVACPRAGCVRVVGRQDGDVDSVERSTDGHLRVVPFRSQRYFGLPIDAARVFAVAARGDRILVRFRAESRNDPDGTNQNHFVLLDVARRQIIPVLDEDRREVVSIWPEASGNTRLGTTASGFFIAGSHPTSGVYLRTIECQR